VGVGVGVTVLVGVGVGEPGGEDESNIAVFNPLAFNCQLSTPVIRTDARMTSPRRLMESYAIAVILLRAKRYPVCWSRC
jgi:hypothetical protein